MRKITERAWQAMMSATNYNGGNTVVEGLNGCMEMKLFGNTIAVKGRNGTRITSAGWMTATTKERLNGHPRVKITQKNHQWYLNGELWDGSWVKID